MYRQVANALLVPRSLGTILADWNEISRILADTPRHRTRFAYGY
jgi:hypothetical protein